METDIDQTYFPIVLAEDDPDDQKEIVEAFTSIHKNLTIVAFDNGKKALEHLLQVDDSEMPCLIILDLTMPEMSGREVLKKLCGIERFKTIPKIILSNSNSNMEIQKCLEDGAYAYKVKPNHFDELVEIANEMLDMCII